MFNLKYTIYLTILVFCFEGINAQNKIKKKPQVIVNKEIIQKNEIQLCMVSGDTFVMGCNAGEPDEKPEHKVIISTFYMGKFEVTNAQYCAFLNSKKYSIDSLNKLISLKYSYNEERCRIELKDSLYFVTIGYEDYPVICVSWFGAVEFCKWLSANTQQKYRLPTEAEWEFAASNGRIHNKYSWGDTISFNNKFGNVFDKFALKVHSGWSYFYDYSDGFVYTAMVGQFPANKFGLYDITGNVWEWCADWYNKTIYSDTLTNNPQGSLTGVLKVYRGGGWDSGMHSSRTSFRNFYNPNSRDCNLGFRVVKEN
jgi:formylglycine-generating enzyme